MSEQLGANELFDVVDDHKHDGLGDEVPDGLTDDLDVRVHQVTDGLNLPLHLGI